MFLLRHAGYFTELLCMFTFVISKQILILRSSYVANEFNMETKKINKLVIKDFMKDNSAGPRLQSLRLPRDLSLGGSKLSKKIYKPNLNVIRNKVKTKDVQKNKIRENYHDSQNVQKQRFIQSTGVFSEGIGDSIRIPERRVHFKEVEKPQLKLNKAPPISDQKLDEEISNYLIKYEEDSSDSDSKESDTAFAPINWSVQYLSKEPVKNEVKSEPLNYPDSLRNFNETREMSGFNPSVTLWQLPDSLGMRSKTEKKLTDCKLTDLPEGKIGKICIRKSGKADVHIGNVKYELEPAELESFREEIVSINTKSSEQTVAAVLNKIESRFVLNPMWKSLLR